MLCVCEVFEASDEEILEVSFQGGNIALPSLFLCRYAVEMLSCVVSYSFSFHCTLNLIMTSVVLV